MLVFDSLGGKVPFFERRLCTFLEVASQTLRSRSFNFDGWTHGSLGGKAPQQPDYYNCGVCCLMLMRSLAHSVRLVPRYTTAELDRQRDLVTLELLRGELLSAT